MLGWAMRWKWVFKFFSEFSQVDPKKHYKFYIRESSAFNSSPNLWPRLYSIALYPTFVQDSNVLMHIVVTHWQSVDSPVKLERCLIEIIRSNFCTIANQRSNALCHMFISQNAFYYLLHSSVFLAMTPKQITVSWNKEDGRKVLSVTILHCYWWSYVLLKFQITCIFHPLSGCDAKRFWDFFGCRNKLVAVPKQKKVVRKIFCFLLSVPKFQDTSNKKNSW